MSSLLRCALRAGFAAFAFASAEAGPALADTRTVPAHALVLNDGLQDDTFIEPDATLHGAVRVTRDDGLDCLSMAEGDSLVIDTARCGSDDSLHVAVPPGFPIVLNATSGGDIKIGDIGGPLTLSLSGSGDVTVGRTGPLTVSVGNGSDVSLGAVAGPAVLNMSGSGDVKMQSLTGDLTATKSGSGDLAVGSISASAVTVDNTGSGDVLIGGGTIGTLRVHIQGSGDFATAATSHDADLSAHGGGDMRVGPVTGTLTRDSGGGSEIHIGSSQIVGAVIADVAHAIGNSRTSGPVVVGARSSTGMGHIITFAVLGFLAFLIFRILRRPGGAPALSRRATAGQAVPTHGGVVAVCEQLSRLDARLGRVEAYVTSREFDLQQKFREMGSK